MTTTDHVQSASAVPGRTRRDASLLAGQPPAADERPSKRKRHGYQDASEVSGRSLTEAGYWLVLIVIAGADVAAFYQVVGVVSPTGEAWITWLLVVGFTAASLALAHFAGRVFRDLVADHGGASLWMVMALAVLWLLLGVTAFYVRGINASSASAPTPQAAEIEARQQFAAALMFLALYLASGLITFFGVYFTRNPWRVAYRRALSAHQKALKRLQITQPPYERAVRVIQLHARNREREPMNYDAAMAQRMAFADELKCYSAAQMAILLRTPPTTDAMTLPDRLPLLYPEPELLEDVLDESTDGSLDAPSQKVDK